MSRKPAITSFSENLNMNPSSYQQHINGESEYLESKNKQ